MTTKYKYYKVLQQNWGKDWDDIGFYETDSTYSFRSPEDKAKYRSDVKSYRQNQPTVGLRVISRKELNN